MLIAVSAKYHFAILCIAQVITLELIVTI